MRIFGFPCDEVLSLKLVLKNISLRQNHRVPPLHKVCLVKESAKNTENPGRVKNLYEMLSPDNNIS